MAAPVDVTLASLNGKFVLNKQLSDSMDAILTMQGISWALRKAASLATPSITISSSARAEDGVTCLEITSVVGGKLFGPGTTEKTALDWSTWEKCDPMLGQINAKAGWVTASELAAGDATNTAAKFSSGTVLKDGREAGGFCDDASGEERRHIRLLLESVRDGWLGDVVWGFETIEGLRRYTRRAVCRKGDRVEMARFVYDYTGEL